ncbi:MAG: hypothetical protein JST30_01485 [Armatimonadetes bacterium]|nr:hypothetical protein [Armatimonadota bacterium]
MAVIEAIAHYVYALFDPRDTCAGPFYIGKGVGNRVFAHVRDALESPHESDKLERIRAIHRDGQEVRAVILRHGLTAECAFEVEAAFIDYIDGLTNVAGGQHSAGRGLMTVEEVIAEYEAPAIRIEEPVILIKINRLYRRGMRAEELYTATRKSWVVNKRSADQVKYAVAVAFGIVREVYRIEEWYPSEDHPARWAFRGTIAPELRHYVGGCVANQFIKGAANPIKYLNVGTRVV